MIIIAGASYVSLANTVLLMQHNEAFAVDMLPIKVEMILEFFSKHKNEYYNKHNSYATEVLIHGANSADNAAIKFEGL